MAERPDIAAKQSPGIGVMQENGIWIIKNKLENSQ
jgi:hypothetical protein